MLCDHIQGRKAFMIRKITIFLSVSYDILKMFQLPSKDRFICNNSPSSFSAYIDLAVISFFIFSEAMC